jgi:anti-sigma regulatory factor (Ser/Thr protein kinase)
MLLVSEVVTNAIIHAHSEVEVAVRLQPHSVRIDVLDNAGAMPAPRDADDDATSGRGLALVEAVASAWGVEPTDTGKSVWFEVPRFDVSED